MSRARTTPIGSLFSPTESTHGVCGFPVPQSVFGVCEGCGAVAWELLDGRSTYCMGCDSAAYRDDDEDDPCAHCDCEGDQQCQ